VTATYWISCDGIPPELVLLKHEDAKTLSIKRYGPDKNLFVGSIGIQIFENLDAISEDLVNIATYVYAADRLITRGTEKNIGPGWKRDLNFIIPVLEPRVWDNKKVNTLLKDTLSFLSDDFYNFHFIKREREEGESQVFAFGEEVFKHPDSVNLFSGGIDSLTGAINDIAISNKNPLLISHWPMPYTKTRQQRLIKSIRQKLPDYKTPHVQARIHLKNPPERQEYTQRSRSFLYLSLASAVARQLGINRVHVYENGVIALNLPIWKQSVGGMDTRTVHPKYIKLFESFYNEAFNADLKILNPFFLKTRAEVLEILKSAGYAELIEESHSCSRTRVSSKFAQHCGVCSQCIDRRVAVEAANLQRYEPKGTYENDVFIESLSGIESKKTWRKTKARAMAVGYVKSAVEIAKLSPEEFLSSYPEIYDATPYLGIPEEEAFSRIYDLQIRQSETVLKVFDSLVKKNVKKITRGAIPKDSLLGIVAAQGHLTEDIPLYVENIIRILTNSLPTIFQKEPPKNESVVQAAAEGLFKTTRVDLDREFPQLAFATRGFKADFTNKAHTVFIEFKYPHPPNRKVAQIIKEMNEKILLYTDNEAYALFVVYDHYKMISDRKTFCEDFEKYDRVFVRIIV